MVSFEKSPGLKMSSMGLRSCALRTRFQRKYTQRNDVLSKKPATDKMFPTTFPHIEWDGSRIDRRFHSGRTDFGYGHNDYQIASGLGAYHYHHGLGPHYPCTHLLPQVPQGESIIDLFKEYGGTVSTSTHSSGGKTTYTFWAIITIVPGERNFALDISSAIFKDGEFYIAANSTRTHLEPFSGTLLSPVLVYRENSPWSGRTGGIDFLVDAEYFHELVKMCTGLPKPIKGREILIPEIVNGLVDGVSKTLTPLENWGVVGGGKYTDDGISLKDENGRYRIAVAPKILDPNYPDSGKIWLEDFIGISRRIDVFLERKDNGEKKVIECVVFDLKAHSFNKYPDGHPRNSGHTASFVVENGYVQTGVAYPNSWNGQEGDDIAIKNMDGSVIEFCGVKDEMDFQREEYRLVKLIQLDEA